MAPKESIEHKRQKEKEKRKREEQEAQDILKSGRFVITEEREKLVADLVRGTMGSKGPNFASVANRFIKELEWPFPHGWLRHQVMHIYNKQEKINRQRHIRYQQKQDQSPLASSQPQSVSTEAIRVSSAIERLPTFRQMEDDWWAYIVSQLNPTVEPIPVPIPIFDVRRAREAQKVFHNLHVKAWRQNGYPPVASQFDVPLVVSRVLRSFHGHRPAPEEEGFNERQQAVSRSPALQGILNVRKDRDERTRKALQKAAKQKGQATLSSFVAPKPKPVEEPLPNEEMDDEAKAKGDYDTGRVASYKQMDAQHRGQMV